MRRVFGATAAALVVAVGAHAWYLHAHDTPEPYETEIRWLSAELNLTDDQASRVRALHVAHCPDMDSLYQELEQQRAAAPEAPACREVEKRCAQSTERLIDEVAAVLEPAQRARYLELVQPCLRREQRKAGL